MRKPINVTEIETEHRASEVNGKAAWDIGRLVSDGDESCRSCAMYYTIAPGNRLGWHSNSTEEIQYFISGSGQVLLETKEYPVRSGDLIILAEGEHHDIVNIGPFPLRVVAFFPEGEVEHFWTEDRRTS